MEISTVATVLSFLTVDAACRLSGTSQSWWQDVLSLPSLRDIFAFRAHCLRLREDNLSLREWSGIVSGFDEIFRRVGLNVARVVMQSHWLMGEESSAACEISRCLNFLDSALAEVHVDAAWLLFSSTRCTTESYDISSGFYEIVRGGICSLLLTSERNYVVVRADLRSIALHGDGVPSFHTEGPAHIGVGPSLPSALRAAGARFVIGGAGVQLKCPIPAASAIYIDEQQNPGFW